MDQHLWRPIGEDLPRVRTGVRARVRVKARVRVRARVPAIPVAMIRNKDIVGASFGQA